MKLKPLKYFKLAIFSVFFLNQTFVPSLYATEVIVDFPLYALSSASNPNLQSVYNQVKSVIRERIEEAIREFTGFSSALSKHYGDVNSLTSHLTLPMGNGSLNRKGSIALGISTGAGFTRLESLRRDIGNEALADALPGSLPTLGVGINVGYAFTRSWDIRFSIFPLSDVELPDVVNTNKFQTRLRKNIFKIVSNFRLIGDDKVFGFSMNLGGFFSFFSGSSSIDFTGRNLAPERREVTISGYTLEFTRGDIGVDTRWEYYSAGLELRASYDLLFFLPYIGFGVGLESGLFESIMKIGGSIDGVFQTPAGAGFSAQDITFRDDPGTVSIIDRARSSLIPIRLLLGFKLDFYKLYITTEFQHDINQQVSGGSIGVDIIL